MLGPGVAALVCLWAFRRTHRRTVTLAGTSLVRSLLFWFVPAVLVTLAYLPELAERRAWGTLPALFGVGFVAILGEELGWRGFLQDALRPLSRARRYALLGLLWELWHFTTRWGEGPVLGAVARVAFMGVLSIGLCWILGECVDRSGSVTVAVTLHGWFNLAFEAEGAFGASPVRAWIVLGVSVGLWAWLLHGWPAPARAPVPDPTRRDV
jgi:membrane protease YdiL (CAAX protease family)